MATTATISASRSTATAEWRAMGTHVVVEVDGSPRLLERARRRIAELESRWSRFRPDSDVRRLNATAGLPVFVHADTRRLVRHMVAAWDATGGACDASVLHAVVGAGYDRDFAAIGVSPMSGFDPEPSPGCGGIVVDDGLGAVVLPAGVGIDPGAIGKGLAADLVVDELLDAGAERAFVSIGGDQRMEGARSGCDGWLVDVVDHGSAGPHPSIARLSVAAGAVATSTTERRRWTCGGEPRHHVIDPASGSPAVTAARTTTVVAAEAWWAEALATHLLLAAPDAWSTVVGEGAALVVDRAGEVHRLGAIDRFLR